MNKFGFGTARIHHICKKKNRFLLLDCAYECGFRHFDTSPYYGYGVGQNTLYEWVSKNSLQDDVIIASKFGIYPIFGVYTKSYYLSTLLKIVSKLINKNYQNTISSDKLFCFLNRYKEEWGIIPNIMFLHEPSLYRNLNISYFDSIRQALGAFSDTIQLGIAGDKILKIASEVKPRLIKQTNFKDYGFADFYYGCIKKENSYKNFIEHKLSNNSGCMLISSNKCKRIEEFSKLLFSN